MKKKIKHRYRKKVLWEDSFGQASMEAVSRLSPNCAFEFINYSNEDVSVTVTRRVRISYNRGKK